MVLPPMQFPGPAGALVIVGIAGGLVAAHLVATSGTGKLDGPLLTTLAVTPATTLSLWWHHFWAGFFHRSWGHLAFNLSVFAVAFPLAIRQQGPGVTMGNALWIGPFTVFALHVLLVLPLAHAGFPYAVRALDVPLVGFSVMAYSIIGMALAGTSPQTALLAGCGIVLFEVAAAVWVTAPFVSVYHVAGLGLGYWVRTLLVTGSA